MSDHQERAGSLQQDKALLARRIQESDEEKTTLIQTLRSSMDEFGKEYDRLSKEYSAFQDRHTVLEQKHSACGVRFSAVEASMHAQQNELIKAGTIQRELIGEIKRVYQLYMQCLSHARAHTSPSHTQELEPLDMTMNGADDRLEDSVGGSGMTGTNGSDDGGEHKDESEAAGDEKSEGGDDDNVNNISMDIYGVAKTITDGNADSADSADIAADISVDGSDVDTEITGTDGDDASLLPSSLISPLDIRPITNEETIAIEKKLEYLHR